jgi:hypothetical protein
VIKLDISVSCVFHKFDEKFFANFRLYFTMKLFNLLLGLALPCRLVVAQVLFDQPVANEVVNGGTTFVVRTYDSVTAPYFDQMTQFELLLLSGNSSCAVSML